MDLVYLLLVPFAVVVGVGVLASRMIRRYDSPLSRGAMPAGERVARLILKRHAIWNVKVEAGDDDFYAPLARRIELDRERFSKRSTSAAAIAAHEAAHAVQHGKGDFAFKLWLVLAIPSTLASLAWFPAAVAAMATGSDTLGAIAFALFLFTVAVSVVTVWIEIDASGRALRELRELRAPGLDRRGARRVLLACGATYVADTVIDFGWIGRRLRRDGDDSDSGEVARGDGDDGLFGGGFD